jgi:hypothetical protein
MNFAYGVLVLPAGGFPPEPRPETPNLDRAQGHCGRDIKLRRHDPVPRAACEFGLMSTVP